MPVGVRALHQHARAREPVGAARAPASRRRGRARRAACRRCTRAAARACAGSSSSVGHDQHGEVGARARPARCRAPRAPVGADRLLRSFASNTIRPRAGPLQASMRHHHVAHLAGGLLHVADRLGDVALRQRDPVDRVRDGLLEGAALRACRARARPRPPRASPSRARSAWSCFSQLAHLLEQPLLGLVLARLGGLQDADVPALKSASGLLPSAAENWLHEVLARPGERLGRPASRTRFWTETALPSPKQLLELLGELAVVRPEDRGELRSSKNSAIVRARSVNSPLQVVGRLLELRLDELGVRAGLLAVEHAGADLDGVEHGPGPGRRRAPRARGRGGRRIRPRRRGRRSRPGRPSRARAPA